MDYFFSSNFNGYIYTIDMVRIYTRINRFDKKNIEKFLISQNANFWTNREFGKFDENYQFDKLWLGFNPSQNCKDKHDDIWVTSSSFLFCLEFNPNKITERDVNIYNYIINKFYFKLKRFDLAIDIPHNINDLVFFDVFKKAHSVYFKDIDDKTFYFGKGDGRIKVYNKKIESNLDFELTRFELTKEIDCPFSYDRIPDIDFKFPYVAFQPYKALVEDETTRAITYAVNNGFPFCNLSRHYKDVIKKDFIGLTDLDNIYANDTLRNTVRLLESRNI